MHRLINLTPHTINILNQDKRLILVATPSGTVARAHTYRQNHEPITLGFGDVMWCEIPLFRTTYGEVDDLPAREEGTYLIVSLLVRQACPGRGDLLSPGELVRDAGGNPIGCIGLTL